MENTIEPIENPTQPNPTQPNQPIYHVNRIYTKNNEKIPFYLMVFFMFSKGSL
jgi:hypothetical protein